MDLTILEKMPASSRLWVYQANRQLTDEEEQQVALQLGTFISQWAAHGQALAAAFEIKYQQFVIIAVDENVASASGCSIDASVHFLGELATRLNIDFFDRQQVAFLLEGEVLLKDLGAIRSGEVLDGFDDVITFNNMVTTLGQFRSSWQVAVKDSWMGKYVNKKSIES